ncbi:hypothetical protein Godav_029854 [Gossypium davidsonii]|uniref:Uncharacterized protein n=2 Tax=Gossypium TaxID=3633 RepID=A0A7J8T8E0_GOSDV|nr:hypothetical protein [Gossypium davidsonii]MBA0640574.1 hypothetical protein [Gossypium klotzschianum]
MLWLMKVPQFQGLQRYQPVKLQLCQLLASQLTSHSPSLRWCRSICRSTPKARKCTHYSHLWGS